MKNILVIQTAFIGDVILATALLEKLHQKFPESNLFLVVRKGNETLFHNHPFIKETWVWDKQKGKYRSFISLLKKIRAVQFDLVVNAHRYASSGILTALSKAKIKTGFINNPFSFLFDLKKEHQIGNGIHEVSRNHSLISAITDEVPAKPRLYPSNNDYEFISPLQQDMPYYCIAPASVWFTKQWPEQRWIELCNSLASFRVYILGAKGDAALCERILSNSDSSNVISLAGKLTLLQSAAVMENARMNFVNDSGPLHLASAMNAPVTAIFCSTVKDFGFYPLSEISCVAEISEKLPCRPCGLHGYKKCPEGHFKCGYDISAEQVLSCSVS